MKIPDIKDGEQLEKFCSGLKFDVRVEVFKYSSASIKLVPRIALRIDSSIWSATAISKDVRGLSCGASTPMEMGNVEGRGGFYRLKGQLLTDYQNISCFKCQKVGCRTWKHGRTTKNPVVGFKTISRVTGSNITTLTF